MTAKQMMDFLHIAERLKDNTRHCTTSKRRTESVAEHSWRVSLMAMMLVHEIKDVDFYKILQMCILHDLGESITGDIPAFWKTEDDSQKEELALFDLLDTLPENLREDWKALFLEMEAQQTKEAKIYKALDKLEAVIQHNESPLDTWLPLEYELNQTYGKKEAEAAHHFLAQLRQLAVEDTKKKLKEETPQKS